MKDLFVELCLTVPVRLSSLLPYLHMLMDPLVSALNGSQTLISQGLRTLELCVDNLQPDFLYDHIQVCMCSYLYTCTCTLACINLHKHACLSVHMECMQLSCMTMSFFFFKDVILLSCCILLAACES